MAYLWCEVDRSINGCNPNCHGISLANITAIILHHVNMPAGLSAWNYKKNYIWTKNDLFIDEIYRIFQSIRWSRCCYHTGFINHWVLLAAHKAGRYGSGQETAAVFVTWFCYQSIAKPDNKTATVSWPDQYLLLLKHVVLKTFFKEHTI